MVFELLLIDCELLLFKGVYILIIEYSFVWLLRAKQSIFIYFTLSFNDW